VIEQFVELLRLTPADMNIFDPNRSQAFNAKFANLLNLRYLSKFCRSQQPHPEADAQAHRDQLRRDKLPESESKKSAALSALKNHILKIGLAQWLGASKYQLQIVHKSKRPHDYH